MSPPWMPLYIADFLGDTSHLDDAETGAYLLLIMHYWTAGGLPDDDKKLTRIARSTPRRWLAMRPTIQEFFHDGWRHKRIDAELSHAADVIAKRRSAVAQREIKRKTNDASNDGSNDASHDDTRARASPSHPQEKNFSLRSERARAPDDDWPSDYFERFWTAYRHKVSKPSAEKALRAVRAKRIVTWAVFWAGLQRYVHKTDDRKWCNPATWINGHRWADQPAEVPRGPPQRGRPETFASMLADDMRNANGLGTDEHHDDDAPTLDLDPIR